MPQTPNQPVSLEAMAADAQECAESGDPSKAEDFKKQYGLQASDFAKLYAGGEIELLEKINGAQHKLREANGAFNAVLYQHGNDATAWNTKVVERGGVYRVDVFDADGDIHHGKGGHQSSLLDAIKHAEYAVLPWNEQKTYGPADRFPSWTQENALAGLNEGWCLANAFEGIHGGDRWKIMGTGPVSDREAWLTVLKGTEPCHVAARAFLEANNPQELNTRNAQREVTPVFAVVVERGAAWNPDWNVPQSDLVGWYLSLSEAEATRETIEKGSNVASPGDEITIFPMIVSGNLSHDDVTALVEKAVEDRAYVPSSRIVIPELPMQSMAISAFEAGLQAAEKPVFDAQVGGFVIPAERELGTFKHSNVDALNALAQSRGVKLVEDVAPQAAVQSVQDEIVLTPEWKAVLPILVSGLESQRRDARSAARTEIDRMAIAADRWVEREHGPKSADDMTPTWASLTPAFSMVMVDGTLEGRDIAVAELRKMANAADMFNAHVREQKAEQVAAQDKDASPSLGR